MASLLSVSQGTTLHGSQPEPCIPQIERSRGRCSLERDTQACALCSARSGWKHSQEGISGQRPDLFPSLKGRVTWNGIQCPSPYTSILCVPLERTPILFGTKCSALGMFLDFWASGLAYHCLCAWSPGPFPGSPQASGDEHTVSSRFTEG